jgi:hypothetical protein
MPNAVSAAIASLPLKEMEASLLRSAILEQVNALGLSQADFREAIDIASFLHRAQTRKQRGSMHLVHYIEHPLRNTLRALRYGVTDPDTLIGIVLHDTVEDAPEEFSTVLAQHRPTGELDAREHAYAFVSDRFGAPVAAIVRGLSNPLLPNTLSRIHRARALRHCLTSGVRRQVRRFRRQRALAPALEGPRFRPTPGDQVPAACRDVLSTP